MSKKINLSIIFMFTLIICVFSININTKAEGYSQLQKIKVRLEYYEGDISKYSVMVQDQEVDLCFKNSDQPATIYLDLVRINSEDITSFFAGAEYYVETTKGNVKLSEAWKDCILDDLSEYRDPYSNKRTIRIKPDSAATWNKIEQDLGYTEGSKLTVVIKAVSPTIKSNFIYATTKDNNCKNSGVVSQTGYNKSSGIPYIHYCFTKGHSYVHDHTISSEIYDNVKIQINQNNIYTTSDSPIATFEELLSDGTQFPAIPGYYIDGYYDVTDELNPIKITTAITYNDYNDRNILLHYTRKVGKSGILFDLGNNINVNTESIQGFYDNGAIKRYRQTEIDSNNGFTIKELGSYNNETYDVVLAGWKAYVWDDSKNKYVETDENIVKNEKGYATGIAPGGADKDYKFEAQWQNVYETRFNLDGGNIGGNTALSPIRVTEDAEYEISEPSKTGYEFGGWLYQLCYYDENATTPTIIKRYTDNEVIWTAETNGKYKFDPNSNEIIKKRNYFTTSTKAHNIVEYSNNEMFITLIPLYKKMATVNFVIDANYPEGELKDDAQKIVDLEHEFKVKRPECVGSDFDGWYFKGQNVSTKNNYGSYTDTIDLRGLYTDEDIQNGITLAAKFQEAIIQLDLYEHGGTIIGEKPAVYNSRTGTTLPECYKPGYTFMGWAGSWGYGYYEDGSYDLENGGYYSQATMFIPAGLTMYCNDHGDKWPSYYADAVYKPNKYVIKVDRASIVGVENYDDVISAVEFGFEYNADSEEWHPLPDNKGAFEEQGIPRMVKDGYYFKGWKIKSITDTIERPINEWSCYSQEKNVSTNGYIKGISECYTGNVVLTAEWGEEPYTVHFDINGGDGESWDESYTITYLNKNQKLNLWQPTRKNYIFMGWYIGNRKLVYTSDIKDRETTAVAKWKASSGADTQYTITFDTGDENIVVPSKQATEGTTFKAPEVPEKEGYNFAGWYMEDTYENPWSFISDTVTDNMTLYAKWEIKQYLLYFMDSEDDICYNYYTCSYGDQYNVENDLIWDIEWRMENEGKEYQALYLDAACTQLATGDITITSTTYLYAKGNTLPIHTNNIKYYNVDGVTNPNPTSITVNDGVIELLPVEKEGATFAGWENEYGELCRYIQSTPYNDADIEITARWEAEDWVNSKKDITITFETEGYCTPPEAVHCKTEDEVYVPNIVGSKDGKTYQIAYWKDIFDNYICSSGEIKTFYEDQKLIPYWYECGSIMTTKEAAENEEKVIDAENKLLLWETTSVEKGTEIELPNASTLNGRIVSYNDEMIELGEDNILHMDESGVYKVFVPGYKTYVIKVNPTIITIMFDSNGGTEVKSRELGMGQSMILPIPTKENNRFDGWYIDNRRIDDSYIFSENITLKAKWIDDVCDVTYYLHGGTIDEKPQYDRKTELVLPIPTKRGCEFTGWTINGNTIKNVKGNDKTSIPAGLETRYGIYVDANYQGNTYTVTYTGLEGIDNSEQIMAYLNSATMSSYIYSENSQKWYALPDKDGNEALSGLKISKKGYYFKGWKVKSITGATEGDHTLADCADEDGYIYGIPYNCIGNVVVEAVWKEGEYKVTLNPNIPEYEDAIKEICQISVPTTDTYTKTDLNLWTPKRKGYIFKGWFVGDKKLEYTTDLVDLQMETTAFAHWEAYPAVELPQYTITYTGLDGIDNSEVIQEYLSSQYMTTYYYEADSSEWYALPDREGNSGYKLSKPDHYFKGWKLKSVTRQKDGTPNQTNNADTDGYIKGISYNVTGDVVLEAEWGDENFYVTYDPNGGSGSAYIGEYTPQQVTTQTTLDLWQPTKKNYVFAGWYVGDKKLVYTTDITEHHMTAYAHWTLREDVDDIDEPVYTVTYTGLDGIMNADIVNAYLSKKCMTSYTYAATSDEWYALPSKNGNEDNGIPKMQKKGYYFKGWKIKSITNAAEGAYTQNRNCDSDGYLYGISYNATGNTVIEADWGQDDFFVTFDAAGGNWTTFTSRYTPEQMTTRTRLIKEGEEPKKDGCTFVGWYLDNRRVEYTNDITDNVVTLYAHWVETSSEDNVNTTQTLTMDSPSTNNPSSEEMIDVTNENPSTGEIVTTQTTDENTDNTTVTDTPKENETVDNVPKTNEDDKVQPDNTSTDNQKSSAEEQKETEISAETLNSVNVEKLETLLSEIKEVVEKPDATKEEIDTVVTSIKEFTDEQDDLVISEEINKQLESINDTTDSKEALETISSINTTLDNLHNQIKTKIEEKNKSKVSEMSSVEETVKPVEATTVNSDNRSVSEQQTATEQTPATTEQIQTTENITTATSETVPDAGEVITKLQKVKGLKVIGKKNKATITWTKVSKSQKYNVQIATNKKMNKNLKKYTVAKTKKAIKTSKGTYYVRVRAVNGNIKGKWSKVKKFTIE